MAVDATAGITDLVHALHTRIARRPTALGGPVIGGTVNGIADLVYGGVKGMTRALGTGLDGLLSQLAPLLAEGSNAQPGAAAPPNRRREALLAALNGVLGDYLQDTANPLAIPMSLRRAGVPLTLSADALRVAFPATRNRLVVLLHGLCMNDLQWETGGALDPIHDHGAALARDCGLVPLYLHYNSGLHVSINGHAFAALLEELVSAWPAEVEELVLLAHSMGGLVARSAVHYGKQAGHRWPDRLRRMVFLGCPHHGSPLERGGHWIDVLLRSTGYTAPFARLGRVRSAGITDLRHGNVLDEDWHGHDRFAHGHDTRAPLPLPESVTCFAVAATTAPVDQVPLDAGVPVLDRCGSLPGDGLVPVASALGRHSDPHYALAFEARNCWIAPATGHLELLSSHAVYDRLRDWLGP
jgi:hypothetical protein